MAQHILLIFASCLCLVVLPLLVKHLFAAYTGRLSHVPGPWLARFTRFWLARATASRHYHEINIKLHQKYGPVVRIAPNEYSFDDLEASKIIYRAKNQLPKAPRYSSWGLPGKEADVFSSTNIEHHSERRKQISPLYQTSALADIEHQIDSVMETFLAKLTRFARQDITFDMADWLQFFAFDAIEGLVFGRSFGFLQQGIDATGMMDTIHSSARYGAMLGVFGEWHVIAFRLLQFLSPFGTVGIAPIYQLVDDAMVDWHQRSKVVDMLHTGKRNEGLVSDNLLSSLLAKHKENPKAFGVEDAHYHSVPNVFAGGETTGAARTATIYFLCKRPEKIRKLRAELEILKLDTNNRISMKEVQGCRYLQAVIKESLRLFPPIGLGMPRVVPEGGLRLAGVDFPEGSIVGVNCWVASANGNVFGSDTDKFRPERWLSNDGSVSEMEQYAFAFGHGPRSCLGKNMSLMEMNKLISEFVLRFDMSFADPNQTWVVQNDWFVRQRGFRVRLAEHKV